MDNDKGLYLPLKINLTEWEKSLTAADADLQKAMREMRAATKDMTLDFNVKIAKAKASGDDIKVAQLENQKINAIYNAQKLTLEALNRAYEKSVKEKGADAKATKALAEQLVYQSKALDRTQSQMGAVGLGKKIADELAIAVPVFGKIRDGVSGITSALLSVGGNAAVAAGALGKIGIIAAGVSLGAKGLTSLATHFREDALAAAEANEEVYQLREELNSSYEEAELLAGAARVDGVNLQALSSAVNSLYKNMNIGNEEGRRAIKLLQQYGAEIRDVNGNRKNVLDFFKEMQGAFLNAETEGKGKDFLTGLFGGSSDQFLHFIRGFDYYIEKAKEVQGQSKKDYELSHTLLDLRKQQAEAERQLAAARGNYSIEGAVEAQKATIARLQEEMKLYEEAEKRLKSYGIEMRNVSLAQEAAELSWNSFIASLKTEGFVALDATWKKLKEIAEWRKNFSVAGFKIPSFNLADFALAGVDAVAQREKEIASQYLDNQLKEEMKKKEDARKAEEKKQEQALRSQMMKEKAAAEARAKVQAKFDKEMRDTTATDYEKQINALRDKRQAYIDEGLDEVQADKLFAIQKEQIDKKYFSKLEDERKKQAKNAEDAYKREIEAAKQAREASISEAESTMRANIKILRYADKQRKAGKYNEDDIKAYADRQYMRSNGFRESDFSALKEIGVQTLKELSNARERLFGQFATVSVPPQNSVTNNLTVNFDNTILDNVSAMDLLANKVANIILPEIQRASMNTGGNAYGYSN